AAGDGVAVHHGDGRMARALDALEDLGHPDLGVGGGAALAHLSQVHPGAERRPRPAHDDDPDVAPAVEVVEAGAQVPEQGQAHGVALLGAVEGDGGDAVLDAAEDLLGHGPLPSARSSERAMTMRCTSDGPSPMRRTRASRYQRSSGNSFDTPEPPWNWHAASTPRPRTPP